MIDYQLAIALKEAGYPQVCGLEGSFWKFGGYMPMKGGLGQVRFLSNGTDPEALYCPTLSELIEACGEKFYEVHQSPSPYDNGWIASGFDKFPVISVVSCTKLCKTPEEAVAKLWLALQEKQA